MTAAALLVLANELDRAIQEQDRLILRATVQHSRFLEPAVEVRNGLVKDWASLWQTRQVAR